MEGDGWVRNQGSTFTDALKFVERNIKTRQPKYPMAAGKWMDVFCSRLYNVVRSHSLSGARTVNGVYFSLIELFFHTCLPTTYLPLTELRNQKKQDVGAMRSKWLAEYQSINPAVKLNSSASPALPLHALNSSKAPARLDKFLEKFSSDIETLLTL